MASAARKAALKLPGWSDTEKKKGIKAETLLKIDSQQILRTLAVADVQTIVSKSKEGTVDLSSPQFQFETADFLADAPDTIKVYAILIYLPLIQSLCTPLQREKKTFLKTPILFRHTLAIFLFLTDHFAIS